MFKDICKNATKSCLIYNNKHVLPFKGLLHQQNICKKQYSLANIYIFPYFGEFIATGKEQDLLHEIADSILVKECKVEIT